MNQNQLTFTLNNLNNQTFINLLDQVDTDPKIKEEILLFLIVTIGNIFKIFKNIKNISYFDSSLSIQELNSNLNEIGQSVKNLFLNSSNTLNKYLSISLKKQAKNFINNNKEIFYEVDEKYQY